VDAGDFVGKQPTTSAPRGTFLVHMASLLGYDALTLGHGDAGLGGELLRPLVSDPSFPFVSANLVDERTGERLFPAYRIVEREGLRVGITAVTPPTASGGGALLDVGIRPQDPEKALAGVLPELRAQCDVVVLIARMSLPAARALGDRFPDLDVVVVGGQVAGRGGSGPEAGGALYVTAGNRGQALGRARLDLGDGGRPVRAFADEIVLHVGLPESEEIGALVADFQTNLNEILKEEAVRTAQGRAAADGSYYVGQSECARCHAREAEVWAETKHAHAFATLEDAGSEALPECYRCHVTGSDEPGGYQPGLEISYSLRDVQCEVCHGRGSHHARDGTWGRAVVPGTCARCHDAENSPDFDPDIYWLMIEH